MRIVGFWLLLLCNSLSAKPLDVFVSILPQQYLLEQIAGEHIQIHLLVKTGYAPATYDPLPQQLQTLGQANLYFAIGHLGFELAWLDKIQALNPQLKIIKTDQGIIQTPQKRAATEHDAHQHHYDPHIWLDPQIALKIAAIMRDQLQQQDPAHQSQYDQGYQQLAKQLQSLDKQLQNRLAKLKNRRFMVFHPAWGYFAKRYGLEQIALAPIGKTPAPKTLIKLIKQAQDQKIKLILVQKQFSQHLAKTVAKSINGQVIAIDPLAFDYIQNLKQMANYFPAE